ncbi:hypothetical protein [Corallococcus sp. CA049B]|uniref:hypothetical protein n=1 Tax=Corallococcus sp. CA049B TaxID=2316730 RepID=UPI0011C4485E|nr:hypothetical protein [Corallococcus sp. CA049B]
MVGVPTDASPAAIEPSADIPLATLRCSLAGTSKGVVARWFGEPVPKEFSPVFGFHALRFQFPSGEELEFKPEELLFPADWNCNIFSPGCRYVALFLGRSAGYHIVELEALQDYLAGRRPPFATLRYSGELPEPHHQGHGRWVSPTEFEFFVFAPGDVDGWAADGASVRLRAGLAGMRQGSAPPLQVIQEKLAHPPDDGCGAATVHP